MSRWEFCSRLFFLSWNELPDDQLIARCSWQQWHQFFVLREAADGERTIARFVPNFLLLRIGGWQWTVPAPDTLELQELPSWAAIADVAGAPTRAFSWQPQCFRSISGFRDWCSSVNSAQMLNLWRYCGTGFSLRK